jgi:hypothetical protein
MLFFKRQLPLVISFVMGVLLLAQFYVPSHTSKQFYDGVMTWVEIITAFALLMGAMALVIVHAKKIWKQQAGWGYSAVTLVGMAGMIVAGLLVGGVGIDDETSLKTPFGWGYDFVFLPLTATMFAILAFFIASAAFRAFRAKTVPAAVLLITAVVIMFTSVPLGDLIWRGLFPWGDGPWSTDGIRDWFLNVANVAGKRAILFGVSLGVIATSLRVIVGIERAYLGSD